ncbi:MAG: helix-turn-helix transcriptional regulator [Prevotella sp.]|nr:helix-turn-helix transcriptional regulator [Prevotella sp.]
MEDNMNISAFLIGASTAFFAIFAIHILFWRKERTRFQTVLGCIMAVWAVWNLKDLVITFPGMYTEKVLDWIMIIDGWSALTYTVFVFEAVMPGWVTWRKLGYLSLPFVAFTLLYIIEPQRWVIYAYAAFLWFYAWAIVIIGFVKMKRYLSYVRKNYSNIDDIDVSWLKPVFLFAIISQLAWLFTSLFATVTTDIVYYVSAMLLWLMVLHYCWNFRPIVVEKEIERPQVLHRNPSSAIVEGVLERMVEEQQLFLVKNLTLTDLAAAMGTNRTYVSNYLSQVRGQTFYDYINQIRIEKKSVPLLREHPEYTLDYVANESGFASISTFRRAFLKLTGKTPRQFIAAATPEP